MMTNQIMAEIKVVFKPPWVTKQGVKLCWYIVSNGTWELLFAPLLLIKLLSIRISFQIVK